ncbi:MAG: hypothetical protein ACREJY_00535, partial [Candidatus Rokuibacteriota bacterium]
MIGPGSWPSASPSWARCWSSRNTSALRLITAYAAHTFELMGMRLWITPFFTASLMAAGATLTEA